MNQQVTDVVDAAVKNPVEAATAEGADTPLGALQTSLAAVGEVNNAPVDAPRARLDVDDNPMLVVETGSPLHKNGTVFEVQLYGDGCLDCKHLVEGADVDYKKCHFIQGNEHCPAAYFKIVYIGDRVIWDKKVKRAKDLPQGADRTNRLLALLDEARDIESDDLRQHIMGLIGI